MGTVGSGAGCAGNSSTGIAVAGGDTRSRAGSTGSAADGGVGSVGDWVLAMADTGAEDADGCPRDCGSSSVGVERAERHRDVSSCPLRLTAA
jgi:hypothetical protein